MPPLAENIGQRGFLCAFCINETLKTEIGKGER